MNFDKNHEIHLEQVTLEYSKLDEVRQIFEEAFPENERIDFTSLISITDTGLTCFYAIVDGEVPVGIFDMCPVDEKYCYLLSLAIAPQYRGMRYGAKMNAIIREVLLKGKVGFGVIEALEKDAENYEQRAARLRFYLRDGYHIYEEIFDTGDGGRFQVVSTDASEPCDVLKEKTLEIIGKLYECFEARGLKA